LEADFNFGSDCEEIPEEADNTEVPTPDSDPNSDLCV